MMPWNPLQFLFRFLFLTTIATALLSATSVSASDHTKNGGVLARRFLLSFKETPRGSNLTFDCSPSGPCVPCLYSEKSDEKYRCSETGYRIPFKCAEIKHGTKDGKEKKPQNARSAGEILNDKRRILVDDDPSTLGEGGSEVYITYRSCIPPAINEEEKLSVLGFEAIILGLLLISGSVVYFRKKQPVTMSGVAAGRIQMNSRF